MYIFESAQFESEVGWPPQKHLYIKYSILKYIDTLFSLAMLINAACSFLSHQGFSQISKDGWKKSSNLCNRCKIQWGT